MGEAAFPSEGFGLTLGLAGVKGERTENVALSQGKKNPTGFHNSPITLLVKPLPAISQSLSTICQQAIKRSKVI